MKKASSQYYSAEDVISCGSYSFLSVRLSDNSFVFPPLTRDFSGSSLWNLKVLVRHSAASWTAARPQRHPSFMFSLSTLHHPLHVTP